MVVALDERPDRVLPFEKTSDSIRPPGAEIWQNEAAKEKNGERSNFSNETASGAEQSNRTDAEFVGRRVWKRQGKEGFGFDGARQKIGGGRCCHPLSNAGRSACSCSPAPGSVQKFDVFLENQRGRRQRRWLPIWRRRLNFAISKDRDVREFPRQGRCDSNPVLLWHRV